MNNKKINIVIGGDIVPTISNKQAFESGDINHIIDEKILSVLRQSDIRVFNLETPLSDEITPIEKEGPCFCASLKSINGIKNLDPTVLTLSNNHILDQGVQGLINTLKILKEHNISYVGVGENYLDSLAAYYIHISNKTIGIFGCTEHEYTVATQYLPGATPFEPLDISDTIRTIKKKCDFLIVLYHGGKEYYEYPSPELQRRCRKMADCGADIIICQHSHCIGSYEKYNKSGIVYGQGNFILDRYVKAYEKFFQESILVEISLKEDNTWIWKFIPIKKNGAGIRMATEEEYEKILSDFIGRSEKLLEKEFVYDNYSKYVEKVASRYLIRLTRFGYLISSVDNRFFKGRLLKKSIKKHLGKHQRLAIQNCLQCEVHNEILQTYLNNRSFIEVGDSHESIRDKYK